MANFSNHADKIAMADKIRPKVASAFRNFSQKLSRSVQMIDGADIDLQNSDTLLQKKIDEREKDFRKSVANLFAKFKNPYGVLGKSSREAQEIVQDEKNLVMAYNLFKAVNKANEELGDGETCVKVSGIKSPLTQKLRYTSGGDFIYLQCYLMFCQGIRDFVPVLEEVENNLETSWRLDFVSADCHVWSWQDKEIVAAVREC